MNLGANEGFQLAKISSLIIKDSTLTNFTNRIILCTTCPSSFILNSTLAHSFNGLLIDTCRFYINNSWFEYLGHPTVYGGAITSWTSNISCFDTVFNNNLALRAGAIGPNCRAGWVCDYDYVRINFTNNRALTSGGAYFYSWFWPNFQDLYFENNTAAYGPNIGSIPI